MDLDLLKKIYQEFQTNKIVFDKMYEYYKGNTDAMKEYQFVTERSNNKVSTNFIKKFIKEEVSYSVGNKLTYTSKSAVAGVIEDIDYYLAHWSEKHDSDLTKNMLTYSLAYELYYTNSNGEFSSKIITPRDGYAVVDDFGNILCFMHVFKLQFDDKVYIDLYNSAEIIHYDSEFNEVKARTPHIFGAVPVGLAVLSDEKQDDTLYKDLKGLQDAYETNLSDISNEISDFRNSYLTFTGAQIEPEVAANMKKLGIIQMPNADAKAEFLIKNINDSFIQNTLSTLEDKMYQLSSHINHNEKMQSNLSSLTLRSRLISLEEKCKLNQKAIADCIKTRLKMLFIYLKVLKNKDYDYKDIKIKFTPNIPQDDLMMSQIISQLGDKLSTETGLAQLSFVDNPGNEIEKIKVEQEEMMKGQSLLDGAPGDGNGN